MASPPASDRESPLEAFDGLLHLAQLFVGRAEAPQIDVLGAPVADLAMDRECPLVVFDRLLHLAQLGVGRAEVSQVGALAAPANTAAMPTMA